MTQFKEIDHSLIQRFVFITLFELIYFLTQL